MTAISCFGDRSRLRCPGRPPIVLRGRSRDARELMFEQARTSTLRQELRRHRRGDRGRHRTIAKWIEANALPHRRRLTLKPSSPLYFQDFLARRWQRRQGRPSTVSRHPASRLHGQPFPFWSAFFPNGDAWSVPRRAGRESRRERTAPSIPRRLANLPGRRGRSLHEADAMLTLLRPPRSLC